TRNADLGVDVFEGHPYGHADRERRRIAADQVGQDLHAVLELDPREDVRELVPEAARLRLVGDREAVDGAPPRARQPLEVVAPAARAHPARVVLARAARAAVLHQELVALASLPEGTRLGRDLGERLRVLGHRYARPRMSVAPEWRVPSVPPVPWTRASRQSRTWRSPHSPRSCLTASMTRKIPRIPGWFDERPPPSVLMGSAPPSWSRPPSTNRPPSPFLQKPRSSSVTSTVIVNES